MNQVVELKAAYQQLDALKRDLAASRSESDTANAEMQRLRRLVPSAGALGSPLFWGVCR